MESPNLQILGTLEIKLQIYRFFNIPSKNIESDLIFRVAIYWQKSKLAHIWEPWKREYVQNIKNMLKLSYTIQILSQVLKKLSFSFTVPDWFDVLNTVKLKLDFLKTCDKIWIVYDSFSIFLIFWTYCLFQGSHIWANFAICKYMATLKIKSDSIFLLGMFKNL